MLGLAGAATGGVIARAAGMMPRVAPQLPIVKRANAERFGYGLIIAGIVFALITTLVAIRYGIGFMGREDVALPFKLTAVQNYARTYSQWLFLMAFALGIAARSRGLVISGLLCLALYAVVISYAAGGRGTFTLVIVLLAPLVAIYRFGKARWGVLAALLLLFSALLHPLFDSYRQLRTGTDMELSNAEGFRLARSSFAQSTEGVGEVLRQRFRSIMFRISGMESLVFFTLPNQISGSLQDTAAVATGELRVERVLTDHMMHAAAAEGRSHSAAPTMLGLLYFLGGSVFVFVGMIVTTLVCQGAYTWVSRQPWLVTPIVLVKLINIVLDVVPGGVLGNLAKELVVFAVYAFAIEIVGRWFLPELRRKPAGARFHSMETSRSVPALRVKRTQDHGRASAP
jgi:hypothetical protein